MSLLILLYLWINSRSNYAAIQFEGRNYFVNLDKLKTPPAPNAFTDYPHAYEGPALSNMGVSCEEAAEAGEKLRTFLLKGMYQKNSIIINHNPPRPVSDKYVY